MGRGPSPRVFLLCPVGAWHPETPKGKCPGEWVELEGTGENRWAEGYVGDLTNTGIIIHSQGDSLPFLPVDTPFAWPLHEALGVPNPCVLCSLPRMSHSPTKLIEPGLLCQGPGEGRESSVQNHSNMGLSDPVVCLRMGHPKSLLLRIVASLPIHGPGVQSIPCPAAEEQGSQQMVCDLKHVGRLRIQGPHVNHTAHGTLAPPGV